MAKKEKSGPKAGFKNEDTVQAEEKAVLEHAQKQAEVSGQKTAVDQETEHAGESGPTITMQGVSGKKITSTVKVVKVKKAAAAKTEDSADSDSPTLVVPTDSSEDQAVRIDETDKQDVSEQVVADESGASVSEETRAADRGIEETKGSEDLSDTAEAQLKVETRTDDGVKSKTAEQKNDKVQADKQSAEATGVNNDAVEVQATEKSEKNQEKLKEESESVIAPTKTTATLPGTTPQPRKIKSGSDVQAEREQVASKEEKKIDNKTKERDPRQKSRKPSAKAGDDRQRSKSQDAAATGQKSVTEGTDQKRQGPGPNSPNRGQGPTREARPLGSMNRSVTPGKVGNIFDQTTKSEKVDSSLAATAKAFAQRKEQQSKAREERGSRRPGGQGGPGAQGGQGGGRARQGYGQGGGFNRQSEGFGDKDKDDDQKPQFRRKATTRKTGGDEFTPPAASSRGGFAQRDAKDKNKKERERDRGRRDFQDRGLNDLRGNRGRRRPGSSQQSAPKKPVAVLTHVSLPEALTVKELAEALKKTSADVIKSLMGMGVLATLNQVVDYDTASLIAGEFNIETELYVEETEEDILFDDSEDNPDDLESRPPVVAVMGHVDHGKTSLLDFIRQAHVTTGEAGGITQHIGAYQVRLNDRKITFLDTPGHEAFTTMRQRGAKATDIAILVVAADDGVMPQTVEAINHARAANTEIVIAINKIDKPGGNIDKVKQELAVHELIPEEWGGSTIMVPVSAKTGEGIDTLLEMVLLTADILELKANPNRQAKGIVIEAKLDRNRGPLATMLVQRGTLQVGDTIVTGAIVGNIRAMLDSSQHSVKKAGPSVPVEIMGLPEVPEAGEIFYAVQDERVARQLAEKRRDLIREEQMSPSSRMSLDNLFSKMAAGEVRELNLIVKADVQGSVEAVRQSLEKLNNDEVKVNIIHGAVGAVNESDVRLAEISNAIIIGFNVRPPAVVTEQAKSSGVDIRSYSVIYNAIDDIESAMKGMLAPEYKEVVLGHCEIRETFKVSSIGTIGGGYVTDGKMLRNASIRLLRNGIVVHEGQLASLRRFKDDVREVAAGYECGFSLERYNDIKVGDIIEAYEMQEIER